jgi:anti-anti-sigma regulatory factor
MSRKKTKGNESRQSGASTPAVEPLPTDGAGGDGSAGEVFALPPALTIHGVRELKNVLLQRSGEAALVVAVDQVVDVDTAGVQLLLALRRSRAQSGQSLQWRGESTVLSSATGALGLAHELALGGEA